VASHPCARKKRMDGAPGFCGGSKGEPPTTTYLEFLSQFLCISFQVENVELNFPAQ